MRVWVAAAVLLVVAGCRSGAADGEAMVTVFAAASLTDAFTEAAGAFEDENPGTVVVLNLASSSQLAGQIVAGAPADVFASADEIQMQVVADAGLTIAAEIFLANEMTLVVESGNPLGITGLADLADPALILVMAAPEVPAGRYARAVLEAAGVAVSPASLEATVRSVLSKVVLGEADAGIVYASDAIAAGDKVVAVAIPADLNVSARYPIAILSDAPRPEIAADFVEFVRSPAVAEIFERHGFSRP